VMGGGMAGCLLKAGYPLTVYNRSAERAKPLVAAGARLAATPREAAENAEVIISIVADDPASRAMWLGENGALAGAKPGSVLIESTTLSPTWARELAAKAAAQKCEFIDAPGTGTKPHAASGQLFFLAGGESAVIEKVRPVLMAMGRDVLHLGPTGSGAVMKLVNNLLCGVQAASLAECLALAEKEGLDAGKVSKVLLDGAPGSPLVKAVAARMTGRDYTVNFSMKLMEKDMNYALAEGERHAASLKTVEVARDLFHHAVEKGLGEKDFSAVIETLRKN
jgi:3-hydroxyisobutyrate dehydrogenase